MRAKLNREYKVTARELSIDSHGLNFLVICGNKCIKEIIESKTAEKSLSIEDFKKMD